MPSLPPAHGRRWLIVVGAGLAFMAGQAFARFGLTLILPEMGAALGMGYADLGLIAGASFCAYLVCAAPAGAAAARFGPRRVVVGALLLSAASLALTGLAPSFPAAVVWQTLNGAAGAGIIVPVLGLSPAWFEPRHWARATGAIVAGGGIGLVLSGVLVPAVLSAGGVWGWRLAWLSLAAGTLFVALLTWKLLRDPPVWRAVDIRPPGIRAVWRSTRVWQIGLAFLCYGLTYAVYGTFFGAQLIGQRGLDPAAAGRLWALSGLCAAFSGPIGGWLGDHYGRRGPSAILFLAQGAGVATLALGGSDGWYVISALLYGLSVWGFPAIFTAAAADVVGPELTPAAVGLTVLCFGVGQAAGPPAAGLLAQASGSLSSALLLGAGSDLLGIVVALALLGPRD